MRITWDTFEDREYSSGISQGVLYPDDIPGVAWNGLISVTEREKQTGEAKYFDGQKYLDRNLVSGFAGAISAYTYPDELEPYIGITGIFTEQTRRPFGLSYRTDNEIHLVYNVLTAPSKNEYASISDRPEPVVFEWEFTTRPVKISGGKPSSHIVILVDEAKPVALGNLEALIYGDDQNDPSLPPVNDILNIFESTATLQITDNGDGSWTATGPDDIVTPPVDDLFTINYSTVVIVDSVTYRVSSL